MNQNKKTNNSDNKPSKEPEKQKGIKVNLTYDHRCTKDRCKLD